MPIQVVYQAACSNDEMDVGLSSALTDVFRLFFDQEVYTISDHIDVSLNFSYICLPHFVFCV